MQQKEIVIIGAGIAGIATAYYLCVRYGYGNIVLIDRDQPMSFTTSKSGENYRDYWPQECMELFSSASISLMEELSTQHCDCFEMRQFGYDFVSMTKDREIFPSSHLKANDPLQRISSPDEIRSRFPYLDDAVQQVVHINKAGALDVYALGTLMLSLARKSGLQLQRGEVTGIRKQSEKFLISTANSEEFEVNQVVLAAGPMVSKLAAMLDVELNIQSYLQRKFVMPDPLGLIPRDMPFTIFADPQHLNWNDEEHELIRSDPEYEYLLDEFPAGLHIKPESGDHIKLGWAFNRTPENPTWEPANDFEFPNIVLRGASQFMPALSRYVDQPPTPVIQFSGYYTRTPENWPVIGPLQQHPGLFIVGALSGYGTMTANAAGDLLARWLTGDILPDYARQFSPNRYSDPEVMAEIENIQSDGQL